MWLSVLIASAVFSVQAIHVAESLVVDLDAATLALNNNDYVQSWTNAASAGGVVTNLIAGRGPIFQTNVGGATGVSVIPARQDARFYLAGTVHRDHRTEHHPRRPLGGSSEPVGGMKNHLASKTDAKIETIPATRPPSQLRRTTAG